MAHQRISHCDSGLLMGFSSPIEPSILHNQYIYRSYKNGSKTPAAKLELTWKIINIT